MPQNCLQGDELCSPGCETEKYAASYEEKPSGFDWVLVVSPENSSHAPGELQIPDDKSSCVYRLFSGIR